MRNVLVLLLVLVFASGCKKGENEIIQEPEDFLPDSLKNGVLVILNQSQFPSAFQDNLLDDKSKLDSLGFLEEKNSRKEKIKDKFDALLKTTIPDDEIFVVLDSWFYLKTLNNGQLKQLKDEIGNSVERLAANVDIQSRKPMMQGDFFPSGRKPMMQDQMRYDSINHRSRMIGFVGGGVQSNPKQDTLAWIMDTGIDSSHFDIVINRLGLEKGKSMIPSEPNPYEDQNGHGTFIAGILGGKAHNQGPSSNNQYGIGINGVYPGANLVSVKVLDKNGSGKIRDVKAGLEHIGELSRPGDVLNISFGKKSNNCSWGQIETELRKLAGDELGVYIVMSAGNEAESATENFPGCLDGLSRLVTVGSMDNPYNDVYWFSFFSNYGTPPIDWLAPGEYILTTAPGNQYVLVSGTSFSAAIVSGIIYSKGVLPNEKARIRRGPDLPEYPVAKR